MRKTMDQNARLHAVFEQINAMLWDTAQKPVQTRYLKRDGTETILEHRAMRIEKESIRLQDIITVYIEQQTAMMQRLIQEARFSRFPLPYRKISIWTRIQARREIRKAFREWRKHKSESSKTTGQEE